MNLILISAAELQNADTVVLQDRRSEHIVNVLRCRLGDEVRVGQIDGPLGTGRIVEIAAGKAARPARIVLQVTIKEPPPPAPGIDLILALPRPIMLKRVLSQAATLGVERIFLIKANRVEKSFFDTSLLQEENYRTYLLQGLEQAVATLVPAVQVYKRFRPFMEDVLPTILPDGGLGLLAHPIADPLFQVVRAAPAAGRLLLAVGPEGGWVDFEIDKFKELGFKLFSLGPRILRVDTAVTALISQLWLLRQIFSEFSP